MVSWNVRQPRKIPLDRLMKEKWETILPCPTIEYVKRRNSLLIDIFHIIMLLSLEIKVLSRLV